jgi:hypothetical protein
MGRKRGLVRRVSFTATHKTPSLHLSLMSNEMCWFHCSSETQISLHHHSLLPVLRDTLLDYICRADCNSLITAKLALLKKMN